ncbi:hypothetical protein [Humisphaera borealis]|uniref:Uncharacterized protein n=1 Tax=Humisphaera borealis TaxID=2807512 RepID=A0A7M2WRN8_9BACT|nr:hypothetical protein [Humisphaera borealis]QOV87822.1 hypothetical protein IPV69_16205 [Humisphaera borealis]
MPSTEPTTKPAVASYLAVVRERYPTLPATQPLAVPLALRESAHIILTEPVYLDDQGHLWITRHDGDDIESATRNFTPGPDSEHVVRQSVRFVWWLPDRAQNFSPRVVTGASSGGAELVLPYRRLPMGTRNDYRWDRARSWVDNQVQRLIVPTGHGVSVFTFESDREPIVEAHQNLLDLREPVPAQPATHSATPPAGPRQGPATQNTSVPTSSEPPRFLFDPRGLIAWIPATPTQGGSAGAARFVNGRWLALTSDAGWSDRILHLIPLRDGSVTQLLVSPSGEGGGVKVALASVETPKVNQKEILDLVDSLSDPDADIRNLAYGRLTEYGPGIWPILKLIPADDLPPEARSRLNRLLKSQVTPMLGGMALQGDQLHLVARLRDGGVIFYTDQGINVPNPLADEPISHAPAWIAARPGKPVEMLSGALVFQADPKHTKFDIIQGQWIVTMDDSGPQMFLGNSFRKLLRKDCQPYAHVVGIDRRGRWLFRKPTTDAAVSDSPTLIIDPTLPDFTPRLPVWLYSNADEVGWDKQGWPAVRLDQSRTKLVADQWIKVEEGEELIVEPPPVVLPPVVTPSAKVQAIPYGPVAPTQATTRPTSANPPSPDPASGPATRPTTSPSTRPVSDALRIEEFGRPLLTDAAGNRYFGGVDSLVCIDKGGNVSRWSLPAAARGDAVTEAPTTLILAGDARLFLFNRAGRVLRIKPTPDGIEPFLLEETFTQNIPEDERPRRIWVDPDGRIVLAFEKRLAILFPQGFIPTPIRRMMDLGEDDD